jgi:hypothetical protein
MCDELIILEFLESDNTVNTSSRRKRRHLKFQCDPFDLNDSEFIKKYRLSKQLALDLCNEIRPLFKVPIKSTDLSVETKVRNKGN